MYYNFVATVELQYSGYVEADSKEQALKWIKFADWDEAEDISGITVKSIDNIEEVEE